MLSVLMPVFNEARTVEQAIADVLSVDFGVPVELIVVDDGSTDGSTEILAGTDWPDHVRVLHHERNAGKGAAIRTALRQARGEFSTIFDADLEYDANDMVALLAPLRAGETEVAFGVRAFDGYSSHSYLYVLGNRLVTLVCNVLFNVYVADLMTCHKMIRTELFRELPLTARGFTIEPQITASLLRRHARIYEIPVRYRARLHEEGKKLTWHDGYRVVGVLLRERLSPRLG